MLLQTATTTDRSIQSKAQTKQAEQKALMASGLTSDFELSAAAQGPTRVRFEIDTASRTPLSTALNTASNSVLNSSQDVSAGDYQDKLQTLNAIKRVGQQPGVLYAEPNYIRQPFNTPNDTFYRFQWHLDIIDGPTAWDITTGERTDGSEVVVAVVDTGVFLQHEDLVGQLTDDGYDFISLPSMSNDGDGLDNDPNDPGDSTSSGQSSWHGTHVAGTIAAATNNNLGIAGVAWDAKVMPVRVLGIGGGTTYDILQGMYYAAGLPNDSGTVPNQAADIINLSLGGTAYSFAEEQAVNDIHAEGVIIVAASGNTGNDVVNYPAAYDYVVAVGATDSTDSITYYSNYGSHLDLSAPGGDTRLDTNSDGQPDGILSGLVSDSGTTPTSGYGFYEGTSMAAPHVAGVIALMKAVHPSLTAEQLDLLIMAGHLSDDLGDTGRDDYHGYGRINALKAVTAAQLAADGDTVVLPVVLSLDSSSLNIGYADHASVTINSIGGGTPELTSVLSDVDWLSVTAEAVDAQGFGRYKVLPNRTELSDGSYTATVTFSTDDGTQAQVEVSVIVGDLGSDSQLSVQYVILMDETGTTLAVTLTDTEGQYQFDDVTGNQSYQIMAGSDLDADLTLCSKGETCGQYGGQPGDGSTVGVGEEDLTGLDISVELQTDDQAAIARP